MDTVSQFLSSWDSAADGSGHSAQQLEVSEGGSPRVRRRNSGLNSGSPNFRKANRRKNSSTSSISIRSNASGSNLGVGSGAPGGSNPASLDSQNTAPTKSQPTFLSSFLTTKSSNTNSQLTDKLVEKFILMALPTDPGVSESNIQQRLDDAATRPQFSVQLMSKNFINMNARLSIPFITLNNIFKVLNWENAYFNVFLLIVTSHMILTPLPMLLSIPSFFLVYGIMVPQYLKKYSLDTLSYQQVFGLDQFPYPSYFPIQPVEEAKPCNQFSKEFFINMTDLQNFMAIYVIAWDLINKTLKRFIYFKAEPLSNFLFVVFTFVGVFSVTVAPNVLYYCLPIIKLGSITAIWVFMIMMHPHNRSLLLHILNIEKYIKETIEKEHLDASEPVTEAELLDDTTTDIRRHSDPKVAVSLRTLPQTHATDGEDDGALHSDNNGTREIDENVPLVNKEVKQKESIRNIIGKNIPDKQKLMDNIKSFEKKLYIRFIEDEFNFKSYYQENPFNPNYLKNFNVEKLKEFKIIEIYEIQSFNKTEKEWGASIYSNDFFTKNSEIRKNFLHSLKLRRKIQLQNEHIDKSIKKQPASSGSNYSLSSYLKGDISTDTAIKTTTNDDNAKSNTDQSNNDDVLGTEAGSVNAKPQSYSTSLKLVTVPKNYKLHAGLEWRLDLCPQDWCARNHVLDVVEIDDEGKWAYDIDITTKKRTLEFRRRRWTRLVVRMSEYDENYNGDDKVYLERTGDTNDSQAVDNAPAASGKDNKPKESAKADAEAKTAV